MPLDGVMVSGVCREKRRSRIMQSVAQQISAEQRSDAFMLI